MDSEGEEDESDAGVETRGLVVGGEDINGCLAHDSRPGHPLGFVFWVRGKEKAGETEDGGEDS